MPVSNNALVHYTKTLTSIKSIIRDKAFRAKYCNEKIDVFNETNPLFIDIAIPMVSFCDIPFKDIDNHIIAYGHYGIGLSKEWATKNKLNPVIYLEKKSELTNIIKDLFFINHASLLTNNDSYTRNAKISNDLRKFFVHLLGYIKNYSGDIHVNNGRKLLKNYLFYNEREWRFVARDKQKIEFLLRNIEYQKNKKHYNNLASQVKLGFEYEDISYIILDKKINIDSFLKFLEKNKINIKEIYTKIITIEQIKNDF
jgi:hypothetical protein